MCRIHLVSKTEKVPCRKLTGTSEQVATQFALTGTSERLATQFAHFQNKKIKENSIYNIYKEPT